MRKMSLNALVDFAGVSRSQLYDVLSGKKSASIDWIAKISDALDVPPSKLFES